MTAMVVSYAINAGTFYQYKLNIKFLVFNVPAILIL